MRSVTSRSDIPCGHASVRVCSALRLSARFCRVCRICRILFFSCGPEYPAENLL